MRAPVPIISASGEAELSFLGVASRHAAKREWVMVDLGGASTEVVIAAGTQMKRSAVLPIGSPVLPPPHLSAPPKPAEPAPPRRPPLWEPAHAPHVPGDPLLAPTRPPPPP